VYTVAVVVGTRPEAIKMAPVVDALKTRPEVKTVVISTAQHRQMLDQVLSLFRIVPDVDLDLMHPDQDLAGLTARVLTRMHAALLEIAPALVLVQGDTTTVLATALAAFYARIPVAHVEAGLRSHDLRNPFPEEMNRKVASSVAAIHFAPTSRARRQLLNESVSADRIVVTGNTVVDALQRVLQWPFSFAGGPLARFERPEHRLMLVTSHRRESFGRELENICLALRELTWLVDDLEIVYPVHLNPRVRETALRVLGGVERVHLVGPLDYVSFVNLMRRSALVLTDSGGVQEEAPTLGKPLLVLRALTERPEALELGLSKVVGTTREAIVADVMRLLTDAAAYRSMTSEVNPYGDGRAAGRIADVVCRWSRGEQAPWLQADEEFSAEATVLAG
jgi:UDP-N-acetylglucosamine 2-epimerase (non-hydrolysing)